MGQMPSQHKCQVYVCKEIPQAWMENQAKFQNTEKRKLKNKYMHDNLTQKLGAILSFVLQ